MRFDPGLPGVEWASYRTAGPVLAAGDWPSNADLIADVARLYIRDDDRVMDVTYGRGTWWQRFRPPGLVAPST